MSNRTQSGYTLIELLTVVAIIGLIVAVSLPALGTINRKSAVRSAAAELRAIFHLARQRAVTHSRNSGVKFFLDGGQWHYAIYDDTDGDGVRNDDIASGVDRRVTPPRRALATSNAVTIGLLGHTIKDPDGELLAPTRSPVHFNRSSICSFSPIGESTPGTIYLTDRANDLYAVRVYGRSAKIRTLRYDGGSRRWVK